MWLILKALITFFYFISKLLKETWSIVFLRQPFSWIFSLWCLLQVFSFVHAQFTFFHQGFDLVRDLEPTMKAMAAQVLTSDLSASESWLWKSSSVVNHLPVLLSAPQLSTLSAECAAKRKELENKHLLVQQRVRPISVRFWFWVSPQQKRG